MANILGRSFGSDTVAIREENGDWKVTVSMVEKRLLEGSDTWEEKTITTECTDSTFEKAYGVAMDATLQKFQEAILETKSGGLFLDDSEEEDKE